MATEFNSDLVRTKQWDVQWKIIFNPDINNEAQEVILSRKLKKVCHSLLRFFNISQASLKKHLGLTVNIG